MITNQQGYDQANTLRFLSKSEEILKEKGTSAPNTARVISITSGKGGVGKTSITSNLAVSLAKQDYKVLIIDADLGLANIDVVFGLSPRYNLNHFFAAQRSLPSIMVNGPSNIKILPAGSGVQRFTHLNTEQKLRFIEDLDSLHEEFDVVLIDTGGGISENVTYFNAAAQGIIVVTTSQITAITDAYALMKVLATQYYEKHFSLLVNSVQNENEALNVYQKLTLVTSRFLDISIDFLGGVPFDKRFNESLRRQKALIDIYPRSKMDNAFKSITQRLMKDSEEKDSKGGQFFWKKLLSLGEFRK